MAKIGLNNLKFAILTENEEKGTYEYDGAKTLGKAVDCKVAIESNSGELYADDALAESDYTFKKGTITLTVDEDDDKIFSKLMGHTIDEDGEMTRKDIDTAPYVGVGRILTKIVNGLYKYKVDFLTKVKFKEPDQDEKTKGENIEFATPTIEGTVMKLKDGTWSKTKTFDKKAEAIEYLEQLMAVSTSV